MFTSCNRFALCSMSYVAYLLALASTGLTRAAEIHVPDDYATIQAAINAAANGDEIIVASGTYNEAINFTGKAVHLHSADGPETTIMDATGLDTSVVTCASDETENAILQGFTITGGGPGMYIESSSPTVTNCTFISNSGGIGNYGGSPKLTNCQFIQNYLHCSDGGGMYNDGGAPVLINCVFQSNYAGSCNGFGGFGGGMANFGGSNPTVTNCAFIWNEAYLVGGGMYNDYGNDALVTNCILRGNVDDWGNTQIYGYEVASVTYSDVQGGYEGAGNIDADPLFVDPANGDFRLAAGSPCVDTASNWTLASGSDADANCRVMDGDDAGAVVVDMGPFEAAGAILDCNDDGICDTQQAAEHDCNDNLIPDECDISNRTSQDCNGNGVPDECDCAKGFSVDCNQNLIPDECDLSNRTSQDCNGNGVPDECDCANGFSVDCNQNRSPDECDVADGTSQDVIPDGGDGIPDDCQRVHNVTQDARYRWIQQALEAAANGDEIIVAPDTYHEAINFNGKSVYLHSAVGPQSTIIDATVLHAAVVTCANGETANTILEGFTITGGVRGMHNVSSSPTVSNCMFSDNQNNGDGYGGGMYNYSSSPTVTGCTFSRNQSHDGGGMCNYSDSNPKVTKCVFTDNFSYGHGGGMYNYNSSPNVTACTFSGNFAGWGGGMQNEGGSPTTVTNCTFSRNHSRNGGGMFSWFCSPAVTNCRFSGNSAYEGGAMLFEHSSAVVTNCTFGGNVADDGGAISTYYDSAPRINNCTLSGNQGYRVGGIFSGFESFPVVRNCVLWGDSPGEVLKDRSNMTIVYSDIQGGYSGGTGNIDADPLFVRNPSDGCDGWGDNPDTPDFDESENDDFGDLRLQAGSPCIDAANNDALPADDLDLDGDRDTDEPLPFDLDGNPRFVDDPNTPDTGHGAPPIVDMGAYEYQGPPIHRGDANCDGGVDFNDIDPFVTALISQDDYESQYPDCNCLNADIDQSGAVDFNDIDGFVACLINGECE